MFEALAICVTMREWLPLWQDEPTSILAKSDSMAALGALNREGSSKPLQIFVTKYYTTQQIQSSSGADLGMSGGLPERPWGGGPGL